MEQHTFRPYSGGIRPTEGEALKIGYVPLVDSAPLIIAETHGFFRKYGLRVKLEREVGWATVREKIRHGELQGAQAPASMVFEIHYGLGVMPVPCMTALITAHHGNAIVLSNELWELGVRDAFSLMRLIRSERHQRRFTFAGVLQYSSQHYLMRKWLASGGIDLDKDVDLVMIPPPQVHPCLRAGHIDGFCVAEPWGSASIAEGICWSPVLSRDFDPGHPEKIFMVQRSFDRQRHSEHLALIAALIEAARYCDQPDNREEVASVLSHRSYLDLPEAILRSSLVGPYPMGEGRADGVDVIRFARDGANRPCVKKGRWVINEIFAHGLSASLPPLSDEAVSACYREDIYDEAEALISGRNPRSRSVDTLLNPAFISENI